MFSRLLRSTPLFLAALCLMACGQATDASGDSPADTTATSDEFTIETVVGGLENPWSLAFLPNGDMLVTERPGRLRVIRNGALVAAPVSGVPAVYAEGQGGLLDVHPHPDFASNGLVYFTYSKPMNPGSTTALARGVLANDALSGVEDIFVAQSEGRGHYGSRIAFDGDGHVFISVGDRQVAPRGDLEAHPSQELGNHHGVIIRLNEDGSVPQDNPFVNTPGALPEIWSYGHRNPQGLAFHPVTGQLWSNEHGPQGGDELNLIEPGNNYGWPVIGYGVNYGSGSEIHDTTSREGMEQPKTYWVPSIATSGLMIYNGAAFPEWQGDAFVGGLAGVQVARVSLDGPNVVGEETMVKGIGRVRDVRQGPDDNIYLVIDSDGGDRSVVRLVPNS